MGRPGAPVAPPSHFPASFGIRQAFPYASPCGLSRSAAPPARGRPMARPEHPRRTSPVPHESPPACAPTWRASPSRASSQVNTAARPPGRTSPSRRQAGLRSPGRPPPLPERPLGLRSTPRGDGRRGGPGDHPRPHQPLLRARRLTGRGAGIGRARRPTGSGFKQAATAGGVPAGRSGAAPHGAKVQAGGDGGRGAGRSVRRGVSRGGGSGGQRRRRQGRGGRLGRVRRLTGRRFRRAATAEAGPGRAPRPGAASHGAEVQAGSDGGRGAGRSVRRGTPRGEGSSRRRRRRRGRGAGVGRVRRPAEWRFKQAATAKAGPGCGCRPGAASHGAEVQAGGDGGSGPREAFIVSPCAAGESGAERRRPIPSRRCEGAVSAMPDHRRRPGGAACAPARRPQ
ncbi:hypothetical protein HDA36_001741 [Nocardiopsis composta]|uniref:Uncharacterized protein n=1 Tax=Nocardiopsis composta TaxID=157465 RepID=A0A7W8QJK7_9ACTN|nr:hypothetical protein [Nocardiopsis composta]